MYKKNYEKNKNSDIYNLIDVENFIYLFTSRRTNKGKTQETNETNEKQDEALAEYNALRQKIKKVQADVAARYRNCHNGSSLFELVRRKNHFGIDLGKYLETKDEINVYKFLYLLHSLIMLEQREARFSMLINNVQRKDSNLTLDCFKKNLYVFQEKLFSNDKMLIYLKHQLGTCLPEDISRILCFFYCLELYSIDFPQEPPSKRKGGLLLFNILKNPGLEISEAYVVNKFDIANTAELPAYYTKFGYYIDNIITVCKKFTSIDIENPDNDAENKVRMVNIALQFLQKKAFLSMVERQNAILECESNKNAAINQINNINRDLKELLSQLDKVTDDSCENIFDKVVLCLESTRQIGILNAYQEARGVIDEWLENSGTTFESPLDLAVMVKICDIVSYLNSNECGLFMDYGYDKKEINNLRSNSDEIRKIAVVYCENSLYENYNYKRDYVYLCELDAMCYAFLHGYFNKLIKCQGYTLDGTNEKRTLKTVIEGNKNKSNNSNNYIYYFAFLNNLINRIVARRGLHEEICNSMIEFDLLISKLGTAIFKKHDQSLMRKALDKILRITLPFFTTRYDWKISCVFFEFINLCYKNIQFSICEDYKYEITSILSQEILFYYYSYFDKIILTENEMIDAVSQYWQAESGIFYSLGVDLGRNYNFEIHKTYCTQRTIFDVPINVIVRSKAVHEKIIIEIDLDFDNDD
ncbi:MAG: hypothetical protein HDT42_07505 [Ruminococcaceae bacterium]|nr:hypothetical protein [Oscillospiraceae bacterium]